MDAIPPLLAEEQVRRAQDEVSRMRRRKRWLVFFLIGSLLLNVVFFGFMKMRSHRHKTREVGSIFQERYLTGDRGSQNKIAVIRVEGVISSGREGHMGYDGMVGDIREQLRTAEQDSSVKGVILKVDSPGGEVLASDEIYRAVVHTDKVGHKPVVCSMGSLAASGGYYAAMGTRWIVADELTLTGSIGVIMETINYSDLLGKVGVKFLVFKSGRFKDILNGSREPTEDEKILVQDLVMETYDKFVGIVAERRGVTSANLDDFKQNIANGRIFSGKQALAANLVDQNGTFQDAVAKCASFAKVSNYQVIDYVVPFSLGELFGAFVKSSPPKITLELDPAQIHLQQGKLYYMSAHLFN